MSLSARLITRMVLSPAVSRSISLCEHRGFASEAPAAAISNDPNELRLTLASPSKVSPNFNVIIQPYTVSA